MSAETIYRPQDFLIACDIVDSLLKSREVEFQAMRSQMDRKYAEKHFRERESLVRVMILLLDEGERLVASDLD